MQKLEMNTVPQGIIKDTGCCGAFAFCLSFLIVGLMLCFPSLLCANTKPAAIYLTPECVLLQCIYGLGGADVDDFDFSVDSFAQAGEDPANVSGF